MTQQGSRGDDWGMITITKPPDYTFKLQQLKTASSGSPFKICHCIRSNISYKFASTKIKTSTHKCHLKPDVAPIKHIETTSVSERENIYFS
jgi:hypothetical protein